jgi:hypothetical protein
MHYRLKVLVRGAIEGMYVVYTHAFRDFIYLIVTYSSETTNTYHSVPSLPQPVPPSSTKPSRRLAYVACYCL